MSEINRYINPIVERVTNQQNFLAQTRAAPEVQAYLARARRISQQENEIYLSGSQIGTSEEEQVAVEAASVKSVPSENLDLAGIGLERLDENWQQVLDSCKGKGINTAKSLENFFKKDRDTQTTSKITRLFNKIHSCVKDLMVLRFYKDVTVDGKLSATINKDIATGKNSLECYLSILQKIAGCNDLKSFEEMCEADSRFEKLKKKIGLNTFVLLKNSIVRALFELANLPYDYTVETAPGKAKKKTLEEFKKEQQVEPKNADQQPGQVIETASPSIAEKLKLEELNSEWQQVLTILQEKGVCTLHSLQEALRGAPWSERPDIYILIDYALRLIVGERPSSEADMRTTKKYLERLTEAREVNRDNLEVWLILVQAMHSINCPAETFGNEQDYRWTEILQEKEGSSSFLKLVSKLNRQNFAVIKSLTPQKLLSYLIQ